MVFQTYALYPHMSVYGNMAFGLKLKRMPKQEIEKRVRATAALLGLEKHLDKRPKHLSGGQRQRVAMGRAIVREPEVFLMDEPLSNLDAKLRVRMRTEISRLQRRLGVTTIYVTHDQVEATTMGDLVVVMKDGMLQQVGKPAELYEHPENVFVAGFIGSPPMNLTEAALSRCEEGIEVEFGGHKLIMPTELLRDRPGLTAFVDKKVIVGIRPESLHDVELAPALEHPNVLSVVVDVREHIGTEVLLHFFVASNPVNIEQIDEVLGDVSGEHGTEFVARTSARSTIREGMSARFVIDAKDVHFFDPDDSWVIDGRHGSDGMERSKALGGQATSE
jgi:multiple sugar transport system ATP-binding protein